MSSSKASKDVDERTALGFTRHRTNNASLSSSEMFLSPPTDPAGQRIDVSDRLLICSSSNMRNEVVVGGSDHALYSINVNDPNCRPVTMYNKSNGHTDWVTTVTHLADGKVLSGAMDGKLCLWSERNRAQCVELQKDSIHPISKVVSDTRFNIAMTCCYDGNIGVWNFANEPDASEAKSSSSRMVSSRSGRGSAPALGPLPVAYLAAHAEPVLECGYRGDVFVSGDKGGSMVVWDLQRCQPRHRFRAHPGPITAIDCMEDRNTIITCGTDGFVKIWDPRSSGTGLVHKIPAHVQPPSAAPRGGGGASSRAGAGPAGRVAGRGVVGCGRTSSSVVVSRTTGRAVAGRGGGSLASSAPGNNSNNSGGGVAAAISCMAVTSSRGSSSDSSYIITGSGSPADSSLVVTDIRQSFRSVSRWDHHRNGVYSLSVVGDQCVLTGDGMGTLLCHHLLCSELDYPRNCLKYGLGASEVGAVRSINCLNGKVVTTGEDGKVMIYSYEPGMFV